MKRIERAAGALLVIALLSCSEDDGGLAPEGDGGEAGGEGGAGTSEGGQAQPSDPFEVLDAPGDPADADCDMSGLWFVRMTTVSQALGAAQFANIWYYVQLQQEGEQVTVVDHFDCGIEVATVAGPVRLMPATTRALIAHNSQVGREGTMRKNGDACELEMERFWSVRGLDEDADFLPEPRTRDDVGIADLADTAPLPTPDAPQGEQDWDGDGNPGITWTLPGGNRYTVQRDWHQWLSDDDHPLPAAEDFTEPLELASDFDNDEVVWDADAAILEAVATPDRTADNRATFLFLGRDGDDPRAQQALDLDDRFQTCLAAQEQLPPLDE